MGKYFVCADAGDRLLWASDSEDGWSFSPSINRAYMFDTGFYQKEFMELDSAPVHDESGRRVHQRNMGAVFIDKAEMGEPGWLKRFARDVEHGRVERIPLPPLPRR